MLRIGKYANTHGLKGEIRILSDFSRKDKLFVPGFKIYMKKTPFIIKTYRPHKNYDMVTLEGIDNIDDIINLKGSYVYIERSDIKGFIEEDLYDYSISTNNKTYKIKDIIMNKNNKILVLSNDVMIPLVKEFIINIDEDEKIVYMSLPKGML